MRFLNPLFLLLTIPLIASESGPDFNSWFQPMTMRLDYYHTGNSAGDLYSFDEVYQESCWAGKKTDLIDRSNLGKYIFKVIDKKSQKLLYSRGFCSIFGEWQTTEQAREMYRSFSESVRFPWPKMPVDVTISCRDEGNIFQEVWRITLDPAETNFIRAANPDDIPTTDLMIQGDIESKVDIVVLPDGYRRNEMKKFHKDADRMLKALFQTEPFRSARKRFNVRTVDVASAEKGIDDPQRGIFRENILSCSFNAFGSDRYILTWDNKNLKKAAARVPYEHICILVNSDKYGGGGIFNCYTTCVSDNQWSDYIFVHEFGHSFGGLGDEYYSSSVAYSDFYPAGTEPWEPNLTTTLDRDGLKWGNLIDDRTPVPTPWNKSAFDAHQREYENSRKKMTTDKVDAVRIDSLVAANDAWVQEFLRSLPYWGKVGLYEGAGYASQGIFRPYPDCRMFTRSLTGFDPVCSRAIQNMIDFYSENQ